MKFLNDQEQKERRKVTEAAVLLNTKMGGYGEDAAAKAVAEQHASEIRGTSHSSKKSWLPRATEKRVN